MCGLLFAAAAQVAVAQTADPAGFYTVGELASIMSQASKSCLARSSDLGRARCCDRCCLTILGDGAAVIDWEDIYRVSVIFSLGQHVLGSHPLIGLATA